jgi:hypothetical protein
VSMALQRVVVRLLHDPTLVARVYGGEDLPELDAREHGWIRAVDRRAWSVDPYRRGRLLHALVGEYPVAVAARGLAGLDLFFADPTFHRCVQERGHLALAFGTWLGNSGFARLEHAIAQARRGSSGRLAPGVVPIATPAGTLAAWTSARATLGEDPAAAVVAGFCVLEPSGGLEHLLVHGERVGTVSADLHAVLVAAAAGNDPVAAARRRGASRREAAALVAELTADGILTP